MERNEDKRSIRLSHGSIVIIILYQIFPLNIFLLRNRKGKKLKRLQKNKQLESEIKKKSAVRARARAAAETAVSVRAMRDMGLLRGTRRSGVLCAGMRHLHSRPHPVRR